MTGRARAAIRRATREAAKAQFGGLGRQIVERAFERAGKKFAEAKLKAALPRLARASIDDVFIGVGRGEIYSTDVVRAVHPDFKEERKAGAAVPQNESGWFGLPKAADLVFRVPGKSDPACGAAVARHRSRDARCVSRPRAGRCRASASSAFAGPRASPSIRSTRPRSIDYNDEPERWLDVRWDLENAPKALYSTQIVVTMLNEPGALGAIATDDRRIRRQYRRHRRPRPAGRISANCASICRCATSSTSTRSSRSCAARASVHKVERLSG